MYWSTNAFKHVAHADMCERTQRDTDVRACAQNDAVGSCNVDATQKRPRGGEQRYIFGRVCHGREKQEK